MEFTKFLAAGVCLAGLSASLPDAPAQTFQGGVRGKIQDAGGAVIPGAAVALQNEETGAGRRTQSNAAGEYAFANLQPGTYTLRAQAEGFNSFVSEALLVGVSALLVVDAALQVGDVDEVVTVTGETPLVENGTASVSSTIDRAQIEKLPTPGRNVFIMAVNTPNVVHTGNPVWVKQSDQTNSSLLSLGGGPLRGNNYTVDGVSMTDMRNRSVIIPIFEAVQEMKVQTNAYDAEMGRTGGGVFNTIHRSGANKWAGSALYQFRPGKLNTFWRKLSYFQQRDFDAGVIGRQDLENVPYNLAGGSFGGPIARGRTFFWTAAEGYSDNAVSNATITVPGAAEAEGDFSRQGGAIYDPLDRDAAGARRAFADNRIPASRIDRTGAALSEMLASLGPGGNLSTSGSQTVRAFQVTSNVNHSFNDNWRLSGTYLRYLSEEPLFGHYRDLLNAASSPDFGIGAAVLDRNVHALALNNTFLLNSASVLNLRYGQTYFYDSFGNPAFGKDDMRSRLGIEGGFLDDIYAQEGYKGQFPLISVAGFGNGGMTHGSETNDNVVWSSREIAGTFSQFIGNHTLKYGAQWRRLGLSTVSYGHGLTFDFSRKFTQGPDPANPETGSGSGLADLLLGIPDGGGATLAAPAHVFFDYFGGFIQDDWRVSSRLVLNLGLRVEYETGLHEDGNDFAVGWDRENPFPVQAAPAPGIEESLPGFPLRGGLMYAGVEGNPVHQWDPPAIKLGPRLGFAYSPTPKTVLRGGYAVFWAPYAIPSGTGASEIGAYGYSAVTNLARSVDGIAPPQASASNPFPDGILLPTGNANGRLQNIAGDVYFNEQYRKSPVISKWSLDVQRDLGNETALKAGYVGSRGKDLPIGGTLDSVININQLGDRYLALGDRLNRRYPNPFYGNDAFGAFAASRTLPLGQLLRPFPHFRNVYARHVSSGKSLYNSLRFELEKRFRGNWGAKINYTFTRHKDNVYEANTLLESLSDAVYDTPDECAFARCPVLEDDYSHSLLNAPHMTNLNLMYAIPGRSKLLRGWTVSMAAILRSGFPLALTQNENPLSAYGFSRQRPQNDAVSGGGDPAGRADRYVAAGSLEPTRGLSLSAAPRTTAAVRSPALVNWDFSFEKSTPLGDKADLRLRLEFINLFNNVNWRGPRTVYGLDNFGSIPGTRGFPRTFQLMTRIAF